MRIALVSLDQRWRDKSANLERCRSFVKKAHNAECQTVIFPEMTLTGYSFDVASEGEDEQRSETMSAFAELARDYSMDIVFGLCLKRAEDSQPHNVLCHVKPDQVITRYAKVHPFTFAGEQKFIEPGNHLGFVGLPGMRLGASICYDLRFPILYALMAPFCAGALCIANWPSPRVHHWRALLVSRAIENQMFMIGVNRIGVDGNGLAYEKSSLLVSPDGQVIKPIVAGEELDIYDIDADATDSYRAAFPTLRDANFDRYLKLRETLSNEIPYGND